MNYWFLRKQQSKKCYEQVTHVGMQRGDLRRHQGSDEGRFPSRCSSSIQTWACFLITGGWIDSLVYSRKHIIRKKTQHDKQSPINGLKEVQSLLKIFMRWRWKHLGLSWLKVRDRATGVRFKRRVLIKEMIQNLFSKNCICCNLRAIILIQSIECWKKVRPVNKVSISFGELHVNVWFVCLQAMSIFQCVSS